MRFADSRRLNENSQTSTFQDSELKFIWVLEKGFGVMCMWTFVDYSYCGIKA